MTSRAITVTLSWTDDVEFDGLTGAEARDKVTERFEAMSMYYCADLLVTVSGT